MPKSIDSARLLRFLLPDEPLPPHTPADEAAFVQHQQAAAIVTWRVSLLWSFICLVGWWPTDPLLFSDPGAVHAMAVLRAYAAIGTLCAFVLLGWAPLAQRFSVVVAVAVASSVALVAGWQLGSVGGPSGPWFSFVYPLVVAPVGMSVTVGRRIAVTAVLAAACIGGFFGMHPEHWRDPLAPPQVNFMFFLGVTSVVAGVHLDRLRRRAFFLLRESERHARELREFKALLERRVEERTAEVRELSRHLESAREGERARLARELHDELGQELTALRYALELTRRRHSSDPASVGPNLADLEQLLQRTRLTAREIVTDLRPRVLDDLGLGAALEWLTDRVSERTRVECLLDMPQRDLPVAPEVATAVFRIVQEALTNATRHGEPKLIAVRVAPEPGGAEAGAPDGLVVEVTDDGAGFDVAAVPRGFGLLGSRERARGLGGRYAVESAPGKGTRVLAWLPTNPSSERSAA